MYYGASSNACFYVVDVVKMELKKRKRKRERKNQKPMKKQKTTIIMQRDKI